MICFQYESIFNFFTAGTMASKLSISVIKKRIIKEQLYLVIGSNEMRISMQRQTSNTKATTLVPSCTWSFSPIVVIRLSLIQTRCFTGHLVCKSYHIQEFTDSDITLISSMLLLTVPSGHIYDIMLLPL